MCISRQYKLYRMGIPIPEKDKEFIENFANLTAKLTAKKVNIPKYKGFVFKKREKIIMFLDCREGSIYYPDAYLWYDYTFFSKNNKGNYSPEELEKIVVALLKYSIEDKFNIKTHPHEDCINYLNELTIIFNTEKRNQSYKPKT